MKISNLFSRFITLTQLTLRKPICVAIKINELWSWKNFTQNLHNDHSNSAKDQFYSHSSFGDRHIQVAQDVVRVLFRTIMFERVSDTNGLLSFGPYCRLLVLKRRPFDVDTYQVRPWHYHGFYPLTHGRCLAAKKKKTINDSEINRINFVNCSEALHLDQKLESSDEWVSSESAIFGKHLQAVT